MYRHLELVRDQVIFSNEEVDGAPPLPSIQQITGLSTSQGILLNKHQSLVYHFRFSHIVLAKQIVSVFFDFVSRCVSVSLSDKYIGAATQREDCQYRSFGRTSPEPTL